MRLVPPSPEGRLLTTSFLLVTVATLLYFLAIGMVLAILPRYVEGELRGNNLAVGVAAGAFGVSAVLMRPFAGRRATGRDGDP